ncbi:MAG TPA: maleylpyruvate isomerase family mycothiol-dependent enzyme [Propionibacteriaceae bacterium]|jgi:uncharacterized protein (TIGR03083 family)
MPDEVQLRTAANRRVIARLFASLSDEQLSTPSLCAGWTCRDVLGHLVMSVDFTFFRFLVEVARDRGRAGVTSARLARVYGARPVRDLVQRLDAGCEVALTAPGVGAYGPFADSCIHLRDVAIPLGIATSPPVQDWVRVLDFLTTPRARAAGFLPRGRLEGLRLQATDTTWSSGSGALVTGTSEALAISLTGRPALLDDLIGDGVPMLRRRVLSQEP